MAGEVLIAERRGHVLRLVLNRPDVRNALDGALIAELTAAFRGLAHAHDLRAVVLTGAGDRAFCAGADLTPEAATFGFDHARPATAYADMLRAARAATVPVIGRINGHCMAGGMGLLAVCDLAVATEGARFGLPEVKVGMFPLQVAALLQPLIPERAFRAMCFTGEPVSAADAQALGLVNEVAAASDLDARTDALVACVCAVSPAALRRGKHALNAIAGMTPDQALALMEGQIGLMALTADAREGMAAFAGKRPPVWTGL